MPPTLSYERPTYTETRRQPPALTRTLWAVVVLLGVVAIAIVAILHLQHGWRSSGWMAAGPVIGMVVMLACSTLYGRTEVYDDRLDVALHWAGLRVWRRSVPWSAVVRCDVTHSTRGSHGYMIWGRGPGLTQVLYGGDGVSLKLTGLAELAIGSVDPDRLGAAIEAARSAEPAAEPLGSVPNAG